MKKKNSIIFLLLSIAVTTIVPMFLSCYELTQKIEDGAMQLGFPFIYYKITAIATGNATMKYAVHFTLGSFLADIAIAYFIIFIVVKIIKLVKKHRDKKNAKLDVDNTEKSTQ